MAAERTPRQGRPSPKSAGSASLPALARQDSWENLPRAPEPYGRGQGLGSVTPKRRPSTRRIVEGVADEGPSLGPFAALARSDWGWTDRSEASSFAPPAADFDARRRGSEISTSSALSSYSPQSHTFPPMPGSTATSFKRHSVSSFGGYTIGAQSTTSSSMPLLRRHGTRESVNGGGESRSSSPSHQAVGRRTSSAGTGAAVAGGGVATTGRRHRDSSSYSETSSLHSYPPKPRQRTGSLSLSISENDYATGHIQRRGSADSRADAWPSYVGSPPVTKPAPSYQSTLSTYSFPAMPTRSLGIPAPPSVYNPLAPLRKRLARSLAVTVGARELHTEVQLLLELIDALEHCIATFAPPRPDWSAARRASADSGDGGAGQLTPLTTATSSLSSVRDATEDERLAPSTVSTRSSTSTAGAVPGAGAGAATTASAKHALVDEVRLLVREVVELVPSAQRCLADGAYGPLAQPAASVSTRALLHALEHPSPPQLAVDPEWWPRKLVRDCRALLDEAGLSTGQGSAAQTVWALATRLSEEADARPAVATASPPALMLGPPTDAGAYQQRGGGGSGSGASSHPLGGGGAGGAQLSDARREELLLQGKQRWEQYRERQSALEQYASAPS